ncbi:hypothetical protein LINPERPRIM_LOCUS18248 [Linum perenne]
MSFQDQGLWPQKGGVDEDQGFNSSSRMEPKRSHQWFIDGAELDLYPYKKQAVEPSNTMPGSGVPSAWAHNNSFHRESDQFVHQLFGSDASGSDSLSYRNITHGGTGNVDGSTGLPSSHGMEHADLCISYGGLRKVKVDQVKGESEVSHYPKEHNSLAQIDFSIPENQEVNTGGDGSLILTGPAATSKEEDHVLFINQIYNEGVHAGMGNTSAYIERVINAMPINTCGKEDENVSSFDRFHVVHDTLPVRRLYSSSDQHYDVSLVHTPEAAHAREFDASNSSVAVTAPKPKQQSSKSKLDTKPSRKEAPNSFPTNVRSLLSTGMLDGLPVKYISVSREVVHAVIKDSGYLCGCQSCNYSKVVNAYELERHAGFKSKHPNSHIYFDNGKTIYQIVQELKSTPSSKLFDVIQMVFGAPLNEKAFRIWKESFEAATRELQRIYGKDELNL